MPKLFFSFLIFYFNSSFSQDSLLYKTQIDSILLEDTNSPIKILKPKNNSSQIRYFLNEKSKMVSLIEVIEPIDREIYIYNYYFNNGKLVMLNLYNDHGSKDRNNESAFYYFKEDTLVYRQENRVKIIDLDYRIKKGKELQQNTPKY